MEDLKNQEVEELNSNDEEKTFTQDDVNRIVRDRLKREKEKNITDLESVEEKEKNLNIRELKLDCRESLNKNGLNPCYIKFFKGSTKDDLDNFINLVKEINEEIKKEFNEDTRFNVHIPPNTSSAPLDLIKEAFKNPDLK